MTVRETLLELQRRIKGRTPALDAAVLTSFVLGFSRERLYTVPETSVSDEQLAKLYALAERRAGGEPVAYLTGYKEFYGRSFYVDHRVLIPRPDTETLVETGLALIDGSHKTAPRVLDLCCGSGCVGITLAAERSNIELQLADIDADALEVARYNVYRLLPSDDRIRYAQSDLLATIEGKFDIVLCNPPYITQQEYQSQNMQRRREPRHALAAASQGLEIIRRTADTLGGSMYPSGCIAIETADWQAAYTAKYLQELAFTKIYHVQDLAGHRRVTVGTYNG